MFVIRSIAQAHSGRRDEAVALMKELGKELKASFGMPESRILTGSIGLPDSYVITEDVVESLAKFEEYLDKVNNWPEMARFGARFGELFISGSHRFEVLRLHD